MTLEEMFSKEWTHDLVNIRVSYTILTDIFHNLISRGGTANPETFHKLQEGFRNFILQPVQYLGGRVGIDIVES